MELPNNLKSTKKKKKTVQYTEEALKKALDDIRKQGKGIVDSITTMTKNVRLLFFNYKKTLHQMITIFVFIKRQKLKYF